ncbi:hypothetical protein DKG34_31310 [Streptomyces sp. NWU49]|uniref:protein phosphatase 2C domain-containing protein n=1 Tax=Streptomyces sp. NWU49 TaxID=2201153 RepID=UPI000D67C21F|nr:protein phosphatase 2C domain-containing protein [Streptomyces sp. NWU49]PWJ03771.1 hypothetical protein DKG34_31310 [Streptomyces sp. NWU49]
MSQQGGRPTGRHEDDWWEELYGDAAVDDTGPATAPDSLDDRFASASGTLHEAPPPADAPPPVPPPPVPPPADASSADAFSADVPPAPGVQAPRPFPDGTAAHPPGPSGPPPRGAPWGPPPAAPEGPVAFATGTGLPGGAAPGGAGGAAAVPPPPQEPPSAAPAAAPRAPRLEPPPDPLPSRVHVGSRPPTYDAEPTALPAADPEGLDDLVPDTVLDGARYGACTLRAASVRGDSARYRGEPRRDALLTARFGTGEQALVLVAVATGGRAAPGAHRTATEACRWIGRAVGLSHARLVEDIRAARRGDLKSGLHRLTDRSLGRLRADAAGQGLEPDAHAATLRCLLLPADPACRTRVFFGVGPGGLLRLRDGAWQDIEPQVSEVRGEPVVGFGSPPSGPPAGDHLTLDLGIPTPPSPYEPSPGPSERGGAPAEPLREPFRFRTSIARPGDVLLMCAAGFADPLHGERELRAHLADRWSRPEPPGLAAFLADVQVRVKGYADDRTAAAVWEA